MSRGKPLPPVASDPVTTLLASRFDSPSNQTPPPVDAPTATSRLRRRREPAGMTRQTLYLPQDTADALNSAAARVQAATGGRVSKHEALSAIIAAGVERADTAIAQLRAALLRDLQGQPVTEQATSQVDGKTG